MFVCIYINVFLPPFIPLSLLFLLFLLSRIPHHKRNTERTNRRTTEVSEEGKQLVYLKLLGLTCLGPSSH